MTTPSSIALASGSPAPVKERTASPRPSRPTVAGAWRYAGEPKSRKITVLAALISIGVHVGFLFGFNEPKNKAAPVREETMITLTLEMPDLKDLEEPEPLPTDEPADQPDMGVLVPMLADVPHIPQPTDFVQPIDFSSLVEQPDLSQANLTTIPEHIGRGGKIGEGLGIVFDLADLDREPAVIFRAPVIVPPALKRELVVETVRVEFIVDANGRVLNPIIRASTDHRFDVSAMTGVAKWKFRPGMKGGRKVNTRMAVPIIFRKIEGD